MPYHKNEAALARATKRLLARRRPNIQASYDWHIGRAPFEKILMISGDGSVTVLHDAARSAPIHLTFTVTREGLSHPSGTTVSGVHLFTFPPGQLRRIRCTAESCGGNRREAHLGKKLRHSIPSTKRSPASGVPFSNHCLARSTTSFAQAWYFGISRLCARIQSYVTVARITPSGTQFSAAYRPATSYQLFPAFDCLIGWPVFLRIEKSIAQYGLRITM